jgi:hypothetical protein
MTARAERDQVFFGIISQSAARKDVVDLEIARCAAILATPATAREHLA